MWNSCLGCVVAVWTRLGTYPPWRVLVVGKTYRRWLSFVMQSHDDPSPLMISLNEVTLKNGASSSSTSSKSTKKRWHRSRNVGWNGYSSWVFILQNFLLYATCRSANSNQCSPGLVTPGTTWPQGDINLEYGQPLRIYCMLNEIPKSSRLQGKNASDLVFFRNDILMGPKYITIENETTILLEEERPPPSNNLYSCKLKLTDDQDKSQYAVVCVNIVAVGFKPKKPKNFSCVSNNWENLVCTWEPDTNYISTQFSLAFKVPGRISHRVSWPCPVPERENHLPPNTCLWDASTSPIYRQAVDKYTFILTAKNVLGAASFTYNYNHFAIVIPSEPINLSVINKTSISALLRWDLPYPMPSFPLRLHHRISYKSQLDSQENWQTIDITNVNNTDMHFFNLTDLPHANTVYNVSVSMKSPVAVDEDKWGKFREITFKTAPTLPGLPPETDVGSFEIVGHSGNRDVYIYWQTIPASLENGDNFTYQIMRVKEDGHEVDLQPHEITNTYGLYKGISFNSFEFDIVATNCIGPSNHQAVVRVASQLEVAQKPVVYTKIAFDNGVYELSWSSPSDSDITDYTIFQCENDKDRPYRCSGYLDWVHIPQNSTVYNVTTADTKKVYQFAISANTAQASSGMVWFSSATTLNHYVGKLKSVWIDRTESDEVGVRWELEYSGRIGIIEGFNICYCSVVSSNDLTCEGSKMIRTVKADPQMYYGLIQNLRPQTTYRIIVAVLTENGQGPDSDPLYVTTLKEVENLNSQNHTFPLSEKTSLRSDTDTLTAIERNSSMADYVIGQMKQHCGRDVNNTESDMARDANSQSMSCTTLVDSLTSIISTFKIELSSLSAENRKLREGVLKCNEIV